MNFQTETNADLLAMLKSDEEYRSTIYTDSEGFQTFGIGICLEHSPIPEKVAEYWCCYLLDQLHTRLKKNPSVGQTYNQLNQARQYAMINMGYQLGITGLCGFLNMWAALDVNDYHAAADHALDSVWSIQTPKRAQRIANIIREGELIGYKLPK